MLPAIPASQLHPERARPAGCARPTPDGTAPRKTGQAEAEPSEGQLLGRAAQVAQDFARYGLRDVRHRTRDHDAGRPRRRRSALEELGPTFAKLGQILSTRPDLLPAAVIAELADLQDHVAPLTEAEVVAVMETELTVPWDDVFASIEPDPLASGTIAQVHRATLVGVRPTGNRRLRHGPRPVGRRADPAWAGGLASCGRPARRRMARPVAWARGLIR
ncbi:MAG: AarF/UbiB family protein [Streptosporangiaceae bacterium]